MAKFRVPTPLRPYTGENEYVQVDGGTVQDALDHLTTQYPEIKPHLFNEGALRSFVNIFVGEEDMRYLDGVKTTISDETQLLIIPSIAGG